MFTVKSRFFEKVNDANSLTKNVTIHPNPTCPTHPSALQAQIIILPQELIVHHVYKTDSIWKLYYYSAN